MNLALVAIESFTISNFLAKLQFSDGMVEVARLLNLHHSVRDKKGKFIVPINTTYFIKYVFRLFNQEYSGS
jgi:hypothetical protein